ncbi:ABC transporter permease [Mesorhizobium sp. M7A.F.Ca.CA.001.09.2.1]|uniref:Inner-membrane translocator n=2 Tax=Mesorhizobium ciceri TaxID=39645 RepID=E8TH03_MESCW|nr:MULTISPECIES: ABC transporter permease [Mesorhizobium]RUY40307.1 ABC transporter permease [Mesorhizobium sp. M7A.F.Ca.CA.001.13.2.1]RUZ91098.1 ABC transporter permease [Mesorhizobium sp. M7A.F.Ca.US.003.02.2.1]RVA44593.1 ABC transporter permease [Mesorhizobium sp. M7A.F.Ca.US.001.01.1.1]ADV11202.1 inner-membrane translocator [Mesorhizobium ciceri biovar biserrulae WSM1271]AMX94548.1 ABC transporter permease [Mesorhizobium ciceri]
MLELLQGPLLISLLAAMVRIATPLLFSAMGELVTQRAGIWNIAVEGTMLIGAIVAYMVASTTGSPWLALAIAILACAASSLIMSFVTIVLKAEQFVAGLALNLLASGVTLFWFQAYIGGREAPTFIGFDQVPIPYLSDIPILGPVLFSQRLLTYVSFLVPILVWFFLYRTKYGLEVRCVGENPKALDVKGLHVGLRQCLAIMFGSMMSGFGGAFLMLGYSDKFVPDLIAGRGWLVVVAIIAGNWMPFRIVGAIFIFAFLEALGIHAQVVGIPVPHQLFLVLPYVASLVLLAGLRSRTHQPVALGIPYNRE